MAVRKARMSSGAPAGLQGEDAQTLKNRVEIVQLAVRLASGALARMISFMGVAALLLIQWFALARSLAGRTAEWKGRQYVPQTVAQPARVA